MGQKRLNKLRNALQSAEIDAFFSLYPPDNEYLTGFRGTTSAVIITADASVFLCDFRYIEQAGEQVKDFEVHEVKGTLETRLGEWLQKLGVESAAFEPTTHTVYQRDTVAEAFGKPLHASSGMTRAAREIKDADEIVRIRQAAALAEVVMQDLLPTLEPGISEQELAAQFEYEFRRRGALGSSFPPIVLFGARSSLPHGVPGDRPLKAGDIVLLDFGCIYASYCSDLTRTFAFGTMPSAWFEDIYHTTLRAQLAALDAVRPGARCSDVDAVARDIIRDAGYGDFFGHGLGHGVGLEVHEAPRLNAQSEAILQPGMVVTVEPGIYLPNKGGVRIEDLVVVTDAGCDVLTTTSKELKVLGA